MQGAASEDGAVECCAPVPGAGDESHPKAQKVGVTWTMTIPWGSTSAS
jgi:hypothetical protein